MKRTLIILLTACLTLTVFALPSAGAESYYAAYSYTVYAQPNANATVLGVVSKAAPVTPLGSTNDDWREIRCTIGGKSVTGWIYRCSLVAGERDSAWYAMNYPSTAVRDASGYNMNKHFLQIITYADGAKSSSSGGLLSTVVYDTVVVPLQAQPLQLRARLDTSSAVVYTLRADEACKIVRSAAGFPTGQSSYVYVLTESGVYGFVSHNDCTADFSVKLTAPPAGSQQMYVGAQDVTLYRAPTSAFGGGEHYAQGSVAHILGFYNATWAYVSINGKTGYAARDKLTADKPGASGGSIMYVQGVSYGSHSEDYAYLHTEANYDSPNVALLHAGTKVTAVSQTGEWTFCRYNGLAGYLATKHLTATAPAQETQSMPAGKAHMTAKAAVALKNSPSDSASTLKTYPAGTVFTVAYTRGDWASVAPRVSGDGNVGFVPLSALQGEDNTQYETDDSGESTGEGKIARPDGLGAVMIVSSPSGSLPLYKSLASNKTTYGVYPNGTRVHFCNEVVDGYAVVFIDGWIGYMLESGLRLEEGAQASGGSAGTQQSAAMSQEEKAFIAKCPSRLKRTATSYADPFLTQVYGAIPIGTYCVIVNNFHDTVRIAYYKDGQRHTSCVAASDLVGCYTQYRKSDNTIDTIYTGDPAYEQTVAGREITYLAESLRNNLDAQVALELGTQPPQDTAVTGVVMTVQTGNDGRLHLRQKKSITSKSLGLFDNGTQVTVLSTDGEWAYVSVNGLTGFMKRSFLAAQTAAPAAPASLETLLGQGDVSAAPTPPQTGAGQVMTVQTGNTGRLHLRQKQSVYSKSLGLFDNGTPVTVQHTDGDWAYVSAGGQNGFMKLQFLVAQTGAQQTAAPGDLPAAADAAELPDTPASPDAPANATSETTMWVQTGNPGKLNLRALPHIKSKAIKSYPNDTEVTVYSIQGGWAYVRVDIDGRQGYMMTDYLTAAKPADALNANTSNPSPINYYLGMTTTLYQRPHPDAAVLATVPPGTPLTYMGAIDGAGSTNDGWLMFGCDVNGSPVLGWAYGWMATKGEHTREWYDTWYPGLASNASGYDASRLATQIIREKNGVVTRPAKAAQTDDTQAALPDKTQAAQPNLSGGSQTDTAQTMVVQTGNDGRLHLREKKSVGSRSLGLFDNGTQVTVLAMDGTWASVRVNGLEGYMKRAFLVAFAGNGAPEAPGADIPAPPQAVDPLLPIIPEAPDLPVESAPFPQSNRVMMVRTGNDGRLHLRARMSTVSASLGLFDNGTHVVVLWEDGTWAMVEVNGQQGYMKRVFLTEPSADTGA